MPTRDDRLRALALEELEELRREPPSARRAPVAQLLRLESEARAAFLREEHGPDEVRSTLASWVGAWRALLGSDELSASRSFSGPQAPEHMRIVWDLALGGLWTAVALDDRESVSQGGPRLLRQDAHPEELARACVALARQIYLLYRGDHAEAARLQHESWHDWVELEWIPAGDDTWTALRGIVESDARAVRRALGERARKRALALDGVLDGGAMLRSVPARLVLETESAAVIRLARLRGMNDVSAAITPRAHKVWLDE